MKKVFLTLTMLLLAITGVMRAQELTVHDGTATNGYVPVYGFYADAYNKCEMVYPAAELNEMAGGTINGMTFYASQSSVSWGANFQVFLAEVADATISAFAGPGTVVYEGQLSIAGSQMVVTFDTPYVYAGGNLLVGFYQTTTGSYITSTWYGETVTGASGSGYNYSSLASCSFNQKNFLPKTTFAYDPAAIGGLVDGFNPTSIDLGTRPVGAWMAPAKVNLQYQGTENVEVNGLDAENAFFIPSAEVPFTLLATGQPVEIEVATGDGPDGLQNGNLVVLYTGGDRNAALIPISANAYIPEEGDVVETAIVVDAFPYDELAYDYMYYNYDIPNIVDGSKDAVYKLTFDNDVLFSASTTGADGVAYLYTEDFNGEEGPMDDNYYSYNGPTINANDPAETYFTYDYTGSNTFYGSSTSGWYWGYKLPASVLEANGLVGQAFVSIETATYQSGWADAWVIKGGETPFEGEIIGYGDNYASAMTFFEIYFYEPFAVPDDDLWVILYSDSKYSSYVGMSPVDAENGKIWYSFDGEAWNSNGNYTPVIYSRFLELPTGREIAMNPIDRSFKTFRKGNLNTEAATIEGKVFDTPRALTSHVNHANRGNRNDDIVDMYVPAGTYYAVLASTDDNFPVYMDVADVPAPVQAQVWYPYDGMSGVPEVMNAEWTIGDYTQEMQVLFGTVFPPTQPLIDWTSDLVETTYFPALQHNKTYFFQVNERNGSGTTMGEIIGFTTLIDPVQGFTVESTELYPGEAAVFTWEANGRDLRGYNLYQDGVLVNTDGPITGTTYSVEGLAYNMGWGYDFWVTAVYDEGESYPSDYVTVYMTGYANVNGHVWEVDSITPVYNVAIQFRGTDEYGHDQAIDLENHTNPSGYYEGQILAGNFVAYGNKDAYAESGSQPFTIAYDETLNDIDIIMIEDAAPLGMITATEEENDVLVEWSWNPASLIVDFETGDFSQAEFTLPSSYPWAITTTNPHEGTYCMKSTCEGVASGSSYIQATVDVPYDGKMGFYVKVSTEANYDKFHFYIDGVEQGAALSGAGNWVQKEFAVTEGTHTYKWEYTKDSSVNSNDDCVYVDDITMYRLDTPVAGGQFFDFEDSSMQGWTAIDGGSPAGYGWQVASSVMSTGYGHEASNDCVLSQSYSNTVGVITPNNYLISPTKLNAQAGAAIHFYACAQDAAYAAEHFGVAISTASNTNPSDFTTIQEWTMTAKGAQGRTAESEFDIRGTRAQGNWYEYTVDLSSYAGQQIWVAIRHFNCSDQFYLLVDDITLSDGSAKGIAQNRTLQGYTLYRRNMYGDGDTVQIATPAVDVYSYIDNEWPSLPFGIYSWGIQARYEGNHHYPENRSALVVDFETGDFSQYDFENTSSYPWTIVSDNGSYVMKSGNSGVASSTSAISATVVYTTDGTVSFDALCQGEGTSTFWDHCDFAIDGSVMLNCGANVSGWNNYSYPVTAGSHTFTWSYTKDSSVNPTGDKMEVDNITFDGVAGGSAAGGANDSEILWSNEIEKDMEATVTFNITLNNDQSPVGATIEMVGPETYDGVFEADTLVIEGVRKGVYDITVELAGYETATANIAIEADATYDIFLEEVLEVVDGLYVSPTGWAMWNTSTATSGTTAGSGSTIGAGTGGGGGGGGGGTGTGDTFSVNFDDSQIPTGWTTIDGGSPSGYGWQIASNKLGTGNGHNGSTDCVLSQSYDNNYGVVYPDNYLVSPQVNIVSGSTFSFWACGQDASYAAEHCGVFVSDNGTSGWVMVNEWTLTAKGERYDGPRGQRTQGTWYNFTVDLSAFAGQKYIAIRHFNCSDMFYIDVDDIELTAGSKGNRAALRYKVELNGVYAGETENMYWQHDVEGLAEGDTLVTRVAPVYASGMGDWAEYTWVYQDCSNFVGATDVTATENEEGTAVELSWTMPEGTGGGGGGGGTGTPAQWLYYDNGTNEDAIGTNGGNFWWGVMFPAGSYEGTKVFKTAAYDYMAMTGTVTIYNDGATAPATAVGTANVTLTGSEDFVEVEFAEPVNIDPTKNLWIVYYNGSGATFPAAVCNNTGDANGRWVSLDGTTWEDLAGYGLNYTFMVRAFVGDTERGEIHEISTPQYPAGTGTFSNAGVAHRGNRDMWDLVRSFTGTSAGQQAVATDGTYIYTASWQSTPTGGHTFYQYDLEGNFIEGFDIAGATGIRDLTTDGDYFYGTSGAAQIFILDFTTRTLVGTINCSGLTSRHISYDPVRDGFWSGNWSTLALYSRTGAVLQTAAAPTSAYGSAYYKDADDVEHLYLFCQPNSDAKVYDYNIATNTISGPVFDFAATPGFNGIAGGCFIAAYDGKTCWFGNSQQDPNLVGIYELDNNGTGPEPPVVEGDIIGSVILRDGEIIAVITDPTVNTYVDEEMEIGEHEYCVRVIHGGDPDVSYYAMSCPTCATVNYTSVVENDVVDNIYPNPTHGIVTIEAQAMNHITVVNTLGQIVYDADVNADMIQLNLGQYKAGLYMIRVNTENGVSVKRVTVVK